MKNSLEEEPILYKINHPTYCRRGHLRSDWQFVTSQGKSVCRKCRRITQVKATYKYENGIDQEVLKARRIKSYKNQVKRYPEKNKARHAVRYAISIGKFERKPCKACGEIKVDFHHTNGYEQENWFVGDFLCRKHHAEKHNEMKTLNNIQGYNQYEQR